MIKKVTIPIPKVPEKEITTVPSGILGAIKKRFENIDRIMFSIMIVVVLSLVAIIISVIGLFLDQMRYNNMAYREYSEKIEILDFAKDTDRKHFQQFIKNQVLILQQQNQILELLNKKQQTLEDKK